MNAARPQVLGRILVRSSVPWLALLAPPVLAQESQAVFDAPVMMTGAYEVPFTHVLDVNGDGYMDVFGHRTEYNATRSRQRLNLWLGDGTGELNEVGEWIFFENAINNSHHVDSYAAVADFGTPDGSADIAYAYGNQIRVYAWDGVAAVSLGNLTAPGDALAATAGDYDGDGRKDLAVLHANGVHVRLFEAGGVPRAVDLALPPSDWTDVESGEFTGDGHDDLLVISGSELVVLPLQPPPVIALPGKRSARPAPFASFVHGLTNPHLTIGDIDGDLDLDAVLFSEEDGYRILRRVTPTLLRLEPRAQGGPATGLADVDGDGDLDGVCCGGGGGDTSPHNSRNAIVSRFEISINRGGGAFDPAFSLPGLGARHLAGAVDLDGDSDVELIAGRVVYYGNGPLQAPAELPFGAPAEFEADAVHDLDLDGDEDLELSIDEFIENQGDGTLAMATPSLPPPPTGMTWVGPGVPGDFDGNGAVDFLVECWAGASFQAVHLLTNAGSRSFADAGAVAVPTTAFSQQTGFDPRHVLVADLDGDGALDFAVRNEPTAFYSAYWTTLWFNDLATTGDFTEGETWSGEWLVAVLDLEEDGFPEAVVSPDVNTSNHKLMLRRGLGGRAFDARSDVFSQFDRYTDFSVYGRDRLVTGDFWGDARTDIVTPLRSDGTVNHASAVWFETYGPGWIRSSNYFDEFKYPNFSTSLRIYALDANNDGRDDLVFHPIVDTTNACQIWLRQPDGTYAEPITQMFTPTAFADLDGDSDVDAVSDRVILNRTVSPAVQQPHGRGVRRR